MSFIPQIPPARSKNAELNAVTKIVSAQCPNCHIVTAFGPRHVSAPVPGSYTYKGKAYSRAFHVFSQCVRCERGGLAVILDDGDVANSVLESFLPPSIDAAIVPSLVPSDILAEFREAEKCASFGANRAASALFRSVLEKTLKANGYTTKSDPSLRDLQKRIDAAAADLVITDVRRKKAHNEIRSLGNDVLHDEWREVTDDEVQSAHRYAQRILEDFYDDRPTVEAILAATKRLPVSLQQPAAP